MFTVLFEVLCEWEKLRYAQWCALSSLQVVDWFSFESALMCVLPSFIQIMGATLNSHQVCYGKLLLLLIFSSSFSLGSPEYSQ